MARESRQQASKEPGRRMGSRSGDLATCPPATAFLAVTMGGGEGEEFKITSMTMILYKENYKTFITFHMKNLITGGSSSM